TRMTATKRKYLVRRLVASTVVAILLGFGLARAFAGGASSAPPDKAASLVPASALVYLNLGTNKGTPQWKHTAAAIGKLAIAGQIRDALFGVVTSDALGNLTLDRDVKPWLGNEAAYAQLPGNSQNLLLLRVRDAKAAAATFDRAGGTNAPENFHGTLLH